VVRAAQRVLDGLAAVWALAIWWSSSASEKPIGHLDFKRT
jgi:hypothetical protein